MQGVPCAAAYPDPCPTPQERQNSESTAIITEQATALAKQQRVLQSLKGQVHPMSGLAPRPFITLVKVWLGPPVFLCWLPCLWTRESVLEYP